MMKRFLFQILLTNLCILNGQEGKDLLENIVLSESKRANSKMTLKVNANTGNYDLKYHRLEFTINPAMPSIAGDVTSYFEAKDNLDQITFELNDNMIVSQVEQRGNLLSFTQNSNDEVVITLPVTQNQGVLDSLTISYSGTPISSGFDSFEQETHNGDPVLWTLSEPYGAKDWWPCKQDLNDKIDSIDVFIRTPRFNSDNEEYIAVSNGLEQSQEIDGSDKITHFKHRYPIPAYLIAIAATNYSVYSHTVNNNGNPFDIVNYVYPESLASAQSDTPITVNIMNLFTSLFEEYPFSDEKYGHAEFGWGGGMEHTTVSFMGNFSRNLIAHELAHQWFGNKITCGSWQDIWLNEGFATYLSGLVVEDFDGAGAFNSWKSNYINNITSSSNGSVYIPASDTLNVGRVFNGRLSYRKGAMVLHMLRKKLGDADFFQGIQDYLADPNMAYGYAKTSNFIPIMENVSGENLNEFFNDWVFGEGHPSYTITWSQASPTQINFNVSQVQSDPSVNYFEALVPIRVHGTLGEMQDFVLDNTVNNEVFNKVIGFEVSSVELDPDSDLISRNNAVILSLDGLNSTWDLKIIQSPFSEYITIKKPDSLNINSIRFFDVLGRIVLEPNYHEVLNLSSLSNGLHILQFETNKGVIHKTMLKQ